MPTAEFLIGGLSIYILAHTFHLSSKYHHGLVFRHSVQQRAHEEWNDPILG